MTNRSQIAVGIDFGTTYSGVQSDAGRIAWSVTGVVNDIEVVSEWPGRGKRTTPKAPTTICYEGGKVRWGYELTSTKDVIFGVKLLLDEYKHIDFIPALLSKRLLDNRGLSPDAVAADYLRKLTGHGMEILRRRFGDVIERMDIQYVLTVPAVWSDKAKDATRSAASAAGIPLSDISLISEPEAAALHCLRAMHLSTIQDEDVIVVCDAGGGTVDLISYCVKTVSPPYLEEVTQGTGAACGSMLLDAKFMAFLQELFGDSNYKQIPSVSIDAAMNCWQDTVKLNFLFDEDDDDDDEFQELGHLIPLPGVEDKPSIGLQGGFLALDRATVKGIFESVVEQVVSLVQSQLRGIARSGTKAKAIMLVGGFGESEYLYQRLKAACSQTPVMQPPDAWSAVVRGAVQRGLDGNRVGKRIARCYYGTAHAAYYDPSRHKPSEAIWSNLEETYQVNDRMTWYIKKDNAIFENKPIELRLLQFALVNADIRNSIDLMVCYSDTAPDKVTKDVFKLCTIEFDLNGIPPVLFTTKKNSKGVEYYRIEIVARLTPTSASLLFEMEFEGVPYGSITAKC